MTAKKISKATTKRRYVFLHCDGSGVHPGQIVRHHIKSYIELSNGSIKLSRCPGCRFDGNGSEKPGLPDDDNLAFQEVVHDSEED